MFRHVKAAKVSLRVFKKGSKQEKLKEQNSRWCFPQLTLDENDSDVTNNAFSLVEASKRKTPIGQNKTASDWLADPSDVLVLRVLIG